MNRYIGALQTWSFVPTSPPGRLRRRLWHFLYRPKTLSPGPKDGQERRSLCNLPWNLVQGTSAG